MNSLSLLAIVIFNPQTKEMPEDILNALLQYAREKNRVCPLPIVWNDLWKLLPNRKKKEKGWNPPPPLILAAWQGTTDDEKSERLEIHIRYAEKNGAIDIVDKFIRNIPEDSWLHRRQN